jgi:amino acid adenylation domain-containing protein
MNEPDRAPAQALAAGQLELPAEVEGAVRRLAGESRVDQAAVLLAAQLKVAAVLTGAPDLLPGQDTWHELIGRMAAGEWREHARSAWRKATDQAFVAPGQVRSCLVTVLRQLTAAPGDQHRRFGLLSAAECEALLAASAGPAKARGDKRFHELFEERAHRHPDKVAADHGNRSLTYGVLNRRANQIAASLRSRGLQCEDIVAVVADRGLEWLAAVLAVFKAGGCYLPLEPRFPAARFAAAITRSGCRWVLAESGVPELAGALADCGPVEFCYLRGPLSEEPGQGDLGVRVAANQLAYIYFTSGSTGEPKGAMCEHAGFLNHVFAKIEDLGMAEGDTVAQTAPQCFDISLWQLLSAFLVGGRTLIVEQPVVLDVRRFVQTLAGKGIRVAQLVPSYLDLVVSTIEREPRELPGLRCLAVTGEALKTELVRRWFAAFPSVPLVNCYGITEICDDTNHGVMFGVSAHRSVPIGRPVANVRVYVMDEWMHLVPPGAPGELVFGGVCVGRGYVNDVARTVAAFGCDPYRPAARIYRSGDFGRLLPTGEFEYIGRRDAQVKVSGFRIEIGEIENRLLEVEGVRDGAVVIAGSDAEPQLVGYYTDAGAPAVAAVARALADRLPGYMLPGRLYRVAALPLSANGKIDKPLLISWAKGEADRASAAPRFEEPATDTERRVAEVWSELLKVPVERIGRGSSFAEFGGTSLSAIRFAIAMDRLVTVGDLLHTPTLADVASVLDGKAAQL